VTVVVEFTTHGLPKPQGSKVVRHHGQKQWTTESSRALPEWRRDVKKAGGEAMNGTGVVDVPLVLDLRFYLPRPKGHFGTGRNEGRLKPSAPFFPETLPDLDKLVRAIGDALTGIVWRSDASVVTIRAAKRYADGRSIGVDVRVERALDGDEDWRRA